LLLLLPTALVTWHLASVMHTSVPMGCVLPSGSLLREPWPLKWKNRESPGCMSLISQWMPAKMVAL
jgi:hypothetical protein